MFYSQVILARKGPLGKIWLAAHWDKRITRNQIFATDISDSVDTILSTSDPLALRVSGHLMLGIVKIYSRKVKYLVSDCTETMWKIKMAFRKHSVDLPEAAIASVAIDDARFFGSQQDDMNFPEISETSSQNALTQYYEFRAARGGDRLSGIFNDDGFRADYRSSYFGGLSPSQIAMRSPGSIADSLGSASSKRKGRSSIDEEDLSDLRMSGSGLIDLPDHLSGGRLSEIDMARGEHRATLSEIAGGRLSLASIGGSAQKGKLSGVRGPLMSMEDDKIPAFDDTDMLGEFLNMGESRGSSLGAATAALGSQYDYAGASQRLSAIMGDEDMPPVSEDVYPAAEPIVEQEPEKVKVQRRKNAPAKKARPGRSNGLIDQSIELTNADIKSYLNDTAPITRVSERELRRRNRGTYGEMDDIETLTATTEIIQEKKSNRRKFFSSAEPESLVSNVGIEQDLVSLCLNSGRYGSDNQFDVLLSNHVDQVFGQPCIPGLCDDLLEVYGSILKEEREGALSFPVEFSGSTSLPTVEDTPEMARRSGSLGGDLLLGAGLDGRLSVAIPEIVTPMKSSTKPTVEPIFEEDAFNPVDEFNPTGSPAAYEDGIQLPERDMSMEYADPNVISPDDSPNKSFISINQQQEEQMSLRTAKVLEVMRSQLTEMESIQFDVLTTGASKRTAAACFLEVLQLKTWGYLEVNQESPYGVIDIYPTDRLWEQKSGMSEGRLSTSAVSESAYMTQ